MQLPFEDLGEFVLTAISNIRQLAQNDVPRAKVEPRKQVEEIILRPDDDRSGHLIEGQWDLLGKERFQSVLKRVWCWNGAGRGS